MFTKESLQGAVDDLTRQHGEWSYDIPLPFGVWTRGNEGTPHTRLKRVVQSLVDLAGGSLEGCRILDLGCLEGLFAIECALHGAEAVGIEIRDANLAKARLCKEALGLDRLSFSKDDVRNISEKKYGRLDFIICSGILYHLPADDVFKLVHTMYEMVTRAVVVDTHVALQPERVVKHGRASYWGVNFTEHSDGSTQGERAARLWASWDNTVSFWPTRSSLVNLMLDAGFSSVFECLSSPPLSGDAGYLNGDRCAFVALKGTQTQLSMSPKMNNVSCRWPEGSLNYSKKGGLAARVQGVRRRLRRLRGGK